MHLCSNWDQHGVSIQGYWSNIMHFMCCVFRIQIWLPHFKIQAPFQWYEIHTRNCTLLFLFVLVTNKRLHTFYTIWIPKLHFIVNKYNVQLRNNLHSRIHLHILIQWNTGYLGQELSAQLDIKLPPFRNCNDNTSQGTTTERSICYLF